MVFLGRVVAALLLHLAIDPEPAVSLLTRDELSKLMDMDTSSFASQEEFEIALRAFVPKPMLSSIKHKTGRKPANGAVSAEGDVSSPNAAFAAVKVKHPFFVQLSGCDTTCHASLAAHFGQNNYSPLTSSIVQVVGELDGLTDTAYGPHVSDVFPLLPQMKTSRTVSNDVVSGTGCDDRAKYSLVIEIVPMDADDVRSLIETIRLTFPNCYIKDEKLASDRRNFVTIDVPCEEVGATMKYLSTLSEVTFIDKKVKMQLLNRWATALSQSGAATGNYIHDMNITGEGQIISVADSGLDMNSCYFFDKNVPTPYDVTNYTHRKVVRYDTYVDGVDDDGHGTHVAGSAAGFSCEDYGDFHKHDGNAKGAKIAFFDMHSIVKNTLEVPSDLFTGLFEPVYLDTNARIFSNSWGSSSPPTRGYSEYAFQVDKFMWEYPDALVIFAAGNGGNDPNPTVLSPAISKNCIAVGAAMSDVDAWKNWFITDSPPSGYNSNGIADFSSYGPTKDGRLKPDLSAAGAPIYSAATASSYDCKLKVLQGTSMATPIVAGAAAMVREYFVKGYYPSGKINASNAFTPSGALLKAMLVHSGRNLTYWMRADGSLVVDPGYPSIHRGYGAVTLNNVLNFGQSEGEYLSLFVRGAATNVDFEYYVSLSSTGDVDMYTFKTSSKPKQATIRITLAYTDMYTNSNDEDPQLNVVTLSARNVNSGKTYAPLDAVDGTTGNNVHMIEIRDPMPSATYEVSVTATSLTVSQPYAIVMTGDEIVTADMVRNATVAEEKNSSNTTPITYGVWTVIVVIGAAVLIVIIVILSIRRETAMELRGIQLVMQDQQDQRARQQLESQQRQQPRNRL